DHGVCPLPEVSRAQGKDAGRVGVGSLRWKVETHLTATFGKADDSSPRWIEGNADLWLYLNRELLAKRGLDPGRVETALADFLKQQPGVLRTYTRTELLKGVADDDRIGKCVLQSFHPVRSGDVAVILKPYYLPSLGLGSGTTHGSPHPYDTHVP